MPIERITGNNIGDLEVVIPRLDKRGVTVGERMTIKNLATNGRAIRSFLEGRGYETRKFGRGMFDFAVRKSATEDWEVIDPKAGTGGVGEFFLDMADFMVDAGVGAVSTLGAIGGAAVGAGPGAIAGGAAGAAVGETIRQIIGEMTGLEDNIDPAQIAIQGAAGLALPLASRAVGAAARGAARAVPPIAAIQRKIGAKIAGIANTTELAGEEALDIAARASDVGTKTLPLTGAKVGGVIRETRPLPSFRQAAATYRKMVLFLSNKEKLPFPERIAVDEVIKQDGRIINMTPLMERMRSFGLAKQVGAATTTKTIATKSLASGRSLAKKGTERKGFKRDFLDEDGGNTPKPFEARTDETIRQSGLGSKRGGSESRFGTRESERTVTTTRTAPIETEVPASAEAALKSVGDPTLTQNTQTLVDRVARALELNGVREDAVPAKLFMELKDQMQAAAFGSGNFRGAAILPGQETKKLFGSLAAQARKTITDHYGGPRSQFGMLMKQVERKTRALQRENAFIGKNLEQTEKNIVGLYGTGRQSVMKRIEKFEKLFGVSLKNLRPSQQIRRAEAGLRSRVNPETGKAELIPLITATGSFRELPLIGGLIGAGVGGPAGAGIGALAGGAASLLASPRGVIAMTRALNRVAPGFQRIANTVTTVEVPKAARAAAVAGLGAVARVGAGKSAARQDGTQTGARRGQRIVIGPQ